MLGPPAPATRLIKRWSGTAQTAFREALPAARRSSRPSRRAERSRASSGRNEGFRRPRVAHLGTRVWGRICAGRRPTLRTPTSSDGVRVARSQERTSRRSRSRRVSSATTSAGSKRIFDSSSVSGAHGMGARLSLAMWKTPVFERTLVGDHASRRLRGRCTTRTRPAAAYGSTRGLRATWSYMYLKPTAATSGWSNSPRR